MTSDTARFQKNCDRWSLFCPQAACLIPAFSSLGTYEPTQFTTEEVNAWKEKLDFSSFHVLYVYGLSNTLPYAALKEWCKGEKNTLIILEENLEAIAHFLKSEEADELLNDTHVWLFYLDPMRRSIAEITSLFTNTTYAVTTIYSEDLKLKTLGELKSQIAFFHTLHSSQIGEFSNHSVSFFNNYFHNLFSLPDDYLANHLFGKFQNTPAIICGAGPSLGKNIETLKKLKDRAIIFAGGTSMNALNGMGMTPHFGLGIDPNEEHISRIIANTAFEVPFLFRGRMHHKALDLVHSDKVYVTGSTGYNIAKFFENELQIKGDDIEEGCNVINFSLSLAAAMGCNPIILVGVDLAYSDDQTYAPGMVGHPIHKKFRSKVYSEELIFRNDIHGKPVATLWKWITESLWFSNFSDQHPDIKIINSTEGGLGFARIPNIPLADVAAETLSEALPIGCRLFGELQLGKIPSEITPQTIIACFEKLSTHHEHVQKLLQDHYNELGIMLKSIEEKPEQEIEAITFEDMKCSLNDKLMSKLKDEASYKYLLENFNVAFNLFNLKQYARLEIDIKLIPQKEWQKQFIQLEINRTHYLLKTVSINDIILKQLIEEKKQSVERESKISPQELNSSTRSPPENNCIYRLEDNRLVLIDPDCDLNVTEEFIPENPAGLVRLYSHEGNLKFESYRKEGKLHGPSRFYDHNGMKLAEAWYLNGLQEGKFFRYYPSSVLHSIQRYKQGQQHGKQEYFYENQIPRIIINYHEGILDGDVYIFHSNGKIARKIHFNKGKHDGADLMWYSNGMQFVEAIYKEDRPSGIARIWYENGHLAQQTVYSENSEVASISHWDETGGPVKSGASSNDYFQNVASNSQLLTSNLAMLFRELTMLTPLLTEVQGTSLSESDKVVDNDLMAIADNLKFIGTAIGDLEKLNEQLIQEAGSDAQRQTEAFWKTGALQKEVQGKLNEATAQMQNELSQLRSTLNSTIETILKKGHINKDEALLGPEPWHSAEIEYKKEKESKQGEEDSN